LNDERLNRRRRKLVLLKAAKRVQKATCLALARKRNESAKAQATSDRLKEEEEVKKATDGSFSQSSKQGK